jgi:hypothetical protein
VGAWGAGILQNDTAQDGIVEMTHTVGEDVARLGRQRPTEKGAAQLGAAVGLLLQFSWYSFAPDNDESRTLIDALDHTKGAWSPLPLRARTVLRRVLIGRGVELAARPARLGRKLRYGLFEDELERQDGHPMQRVFGRREPTLFEHPEAAGYAQKFADRCVRRVDEDFSDPDLVEDLAREAEGMGAFALLLLIEPCRVRPQKVAGWRKKADRAFARIRKECADNDSESWQQELEFYEDYHKCLAVAFDQLAAKFGPA